MFFRKSFTNSIIARFRNSILSLISISLFFVFFRSREINCIPCWYKPFKQLLGDIPRPRRVSRPVPAQKIDDVNVPVINVTSGKAKRAYLSPVVDNQM
jgi:hypothetical protein